MIFRNLETEWKVGGLLVAIAVLIAGAVLLFGGAVTNPLKVAEQEQQPTISSEDDQEAQTLDTSDWQTYRSEEFGFEVKYPEGWFRYTPDGSGACMPGSQDVKITILSRSSLQNCGFVAEQLPPADADITVWAFENEWQDVNSILSGPKENVAIGGIHAIRYIFTEESERPNIQASRFYFNYNGKGYLIFVQQSDLQGNYDALYDQILSTFQFINVGESLDSKSYRDENLGFEFQYPKIFDEYKDCELRDILGDGTLTLGNRISIYVKDSKGLTLEEYIAQNFSSEYLFDITRDDIQVGGEKATQVGFRIKGTGRYGQMTYVLHEGMIYHFAHGAGPACLPHEVFKEAEVSVLGQILSTFRFVE